MKRYFMMFSAAVAALVSCHKEPNLEPAPQPQVESHEVTIEAGILSKTVLDGNAVMWEGSDEIALVFIHTSSAPHVNKTFVNQETQQTIDRAVFKGQIPNNVSPENGYNDLGYAVYPKTAVTDKGVFSHNLPATQVAKASGSFPSGCNLSSAALALSEMGEDGSTKTDFRNALSVLRVALSPDVKSVTVTGTAPLAGIAPLQMYYNSADEKDGDNGRLLFDEKGTWEEPSNSVTLLPANGDAFENKTYNILVWPGKQEGLTITLNFKNLGAYEKASSISTSKPATFKPAKFYNLNNVKNTEELVVEEITDRLGELEGNIPDIDDLEQTVQGLVDQIQSISLMTEYLDNAVYARYAQMTYSKQKIDLSLDYIVKPEAAAEALVEAFDQNPAMVSGLLGYGKGAGLEMTSTPLAVKGLTINNLPGIGKVVTATIDASNIDNKFYDGTWDASVALQVMSGETDVMSDFANLVPKAGSVITGSYLSNIPAVPGARVVVPFSYAVSGDDSPYTLTVKDSLGVYGVSVNNNDNFKTGNLIVNFDEGAIHTTPSVTLNLTVGEGANKEEITQVFTFVDNGARINLTPSVQKVDYVGGEVTIDVQLQNLTGVGMLGHHSGDFLSYDSNSGIFTFDENTTVNTRTAKARYTINVGSLEYEKCVTLTQNGTNSQLQNQYYAEGEVKKLQSSTYSTSTPLNIVILGDGYKKMNLLKDNGKFERDAQFAMNAFFNIEPFATFRDRFNVYMAAYSSEHEGPRLQVELEQGESAPVHNTKFGTSYKGASNTYVDCNKDIVESVVRDVVHLDTDAEYYRTIVILLVNSKLYLGSTDYTHQTTSNQSGDGYGSMGIAMVASSHMGTADLIRHEAGGHAFGRLGDEYDVSWYTMERINDRHSVGFYWNVSTNNTSTWAEFTNNGYGSDEVTYDPYCGGQLYRSTKMTGMMYETSGKFNAVCRKLIYERIIKQTQGSSAYRFADFKTYDQNNRR